jgi:hypothetical protein
MDNVQIVQDTVQRLTQGLILWMFVTICVGAVLTAVFVVVKAYAQSADHRPSEWARKRGKGQ